MTNGFSEKRRQNSKRRKAPGERKSDVTELDIMDHRYFLALCGVPLGKLDGFAERFMRTFK